MSKGRIIQSAKLYLQKEGEEKIRHIKRYTDFLDICHELEIDSGYYERTFLNDEDFPPLGMPINEWPEENPMIGKERLFFCVPPDCDFQRIKDVGGTLIQTYGITYLPEQGEEFLDKADGCGLKVLYSIKSLIHDLIRAGKPWDKRECQKIVERFDSHPALWGWYLLDEPDAGVDDPKAGVDMMIQAEITGSFRRWTEKPLVLAVRGGTKGWYLVEFNFFDVVIPDTYVFDGTGMCWGEKPLDYLKIVAEQERDYLDKTNLDIPLMFMFQCDSGPAVALGNHDTKVPLGQIEAQFNVLRDYDLFTAGVGMYAWDGGDFCPNRDVSICNEVYDLFYKIKED